MNAPGSISEERRADTRRRVDIVNQRVALSALIGRAVKLRKTGREHVGLCPFHSESSPSFTVNDDKGFYHCFGCGAHGDAVRFKMEHDGLGFVDALRELEGDAGLAGESMAPKRESLRREQGPARYIDSGAAATYVWREAGQARGTIAENWFRGRGIDPAASGALDVIRFHPRCPAGLWRTWEDPGAVRRMAPALVTPFLRIEGPRGERSLRMTGVHLTFLSGDGREKAYFEPWRGGDGKLHDPARRVFWGNAKGGAVFMPARPLPMGSAVGEALIALADDHAAGRLAVGEGLESTLSLLVRVPDARMACATLSLDNMQGHPLRVGKNAAIPMFAPQVDPERPRPFGLMAPGRVVLGVDADMKADAADKARWVQDRKGGPFVKRPLSSLERSQLCAALAADHWRHCGAETFDVARPPMGCDFNDLDQGRW